MNYNLRQEFAERGLLACLSALSTIKQKRSLEMIKHLYETVEISDARWAALKAICEFDSVYAQKN